MGKATPIVLSVKEQKTLHFWLRPGKKEKRMSERAQSILSAAEGQSTLEITRRPLTRLARIRRSEALSVAKGVISRLQRNL